MASGPIITPGGQDPNPDGATRVIGARLPSDLRTLGGRLADVLKRANATNTPVFEITVPRQYGTSPDLAALSSSNWVKIEKHSESGFVDTSLAAELKARGITDVILMGTNEQQCVLATAGDALNYGLAIHTSPQIVQ